jgi:hypothetical protein
MAKIPFGEDILCLAIFLLIENALDGKIPNFLLLLANRAEEGGVNCCYTLYRHMR